MQSEFSDLLKTFILRAVCVFVFVHVNACICVRWMHAYVCVCGFVHVEVRGQLARVISLLPPYVIRLLGVVESAFPGGTIYFPLCAEEWSLSMI